MITHRSSSNLVQGIQDENQYVVASLISILLLACDYPRPPLFTPQLSGLHLTSVHVNSWLSTRIHNGTADILEFERFELSVAQLTRLDSSPGCLMLAKCQNGCAPRLQ